MKSIEITTTCTLIFDRPGLDANGHQNQVEYQAMVTATVYPATIAENGEAEQSQKIEIDWVECWEYKFLTNIKAEIDAANYDRCLVAVQNKIDRQLNAGTIGTK